MPTTIEIEAARKAVRDHFGAVAMDASLESAIDAALTAAERAREFVVEEEDEQLELLFSCRAWLWSIVQALDINAIATVLEMNQDETGKPKRTTAASLIDTLNRLDAAADRSAGLGDMPNDTEANGKKGFLAVLDMIEWRFEARDAIARWASEYGFQLTVDESENLAEEIEGATVVLSRTAMSNSAGLYWFEQTFGVPLGELPSRGDVERVRLAAQEEEWSQRGKNVPDPSRPASADI